MFYKYTGEGAIELRGVTFKKGKPVDLSDNPLLAEKVAALPFFEQAKKPKAETDAPAS